MIFLISMIAALFFILLCGKALRRHPTPFYLAAVVIAAAVSILAWGNPSLPPGFAEWILPVFLRGGMAGALFVLVMITGAFPNGSVPIKWLMPIRGQLSIIASILTFGHNIAYGKTYFVRLFAAPDTLPLYQRTAAVCSVLMLLLLIPLFVTSFPIVRKRMGAKRWKKVQRLAYLFYALLGTHILLLTVPGAMMGRSGYKLTVFVYGMVFSGYALCRILKYAAVRKRETGGLVRRQLTGSVLCMAVVFLLVSCLGMGRNGNSVMASDNEEQREAALADGVYQGSGMGMNGKIAVSVTVSGGRIMDIKIDSEHDDEPYITDAMDVIADILAQNSPQVDTISGATYSSGGIIDAVADALESAQGA